MTAAHQLTPLGLSALALLAERPMHPYEMFQLLIQRSEDRLVKVRPGSLYHTVERLDRAGLVRALRTERAGNRPERTSYEITPGGREALTERVAEMLATPVNEYPSFPLAVSQAHNLPAEKVIELLEQRVRRLRADLDELLRGGEAITAHGVPPLYWVDLTYQQAMLRAEIEWIDGLVADMRSGRMSWVGHKTEASELSPESRTTRGEQGAERTRSSRR